MTVVAKDTAKASAPAPAPSKTAKAKSKKSKALADSAKTAAVPAKDTAKVAANAQSAAPVPPAMIKDSIKAAAPVTVAKDTAKPAAVVAKDSAKAIVPAVSPVTDTAKVAADKVAALDSASADSTASDSTKSGKPKKRRRIVRETTVNSIDELKGRYRSPKKAMFMSLLVPGLGQAYVGQHWVNYTRAAVYLLTDVALAYGWHYYVVDKQDAQIAKYRKFADENWRQTGYENNISDKNQVFDKEKFDLINPHRQSYCEAVQNRETNTGNSLFAGCLDPSNPNAAQFRSTYNDDSWGGIDSISNRRAQFADPHTFYELVGKEVEFIKGWTDAGNVIQGDSTFFLDDGTGSPVKGADGKALPATTTKQQEYIYMRAKANDYARMQAYFLGGMVVNHLVSALDAALTAHYHNKSLYQTEVRWWDRVHMDGGLAWQGLLPATTVTASVTF